MIQTVDYLWHKLELDALDSDPLWLLAHSYTSVLTKHPPQTLTAENSSDKYTLKINTTTKDFEDTLQRAEYAYGFIHNELHSAALSQGWIRLHAALIEINGVHSLITGPSGAGKTGISIKAFENGFRVHSDEGVFLKDNQVIGLPRRIHIKHSAREYLDSKYFDVAIRLNYPDPVWALDPGAFWKCPVLEPVKVDNIVVLGSGNDAASFTQISSWEAMQMLSTESVFFSGTPGPLVAALAPFISSARSYKASGHFDNNLIEYLHEISNKTY